MNGWSTDAVTPLKSVYALIAVMSEPSSTESTIHTSKAATNYLFNGLADVWLPWVETSGRDAVARIVPTVCTPGGGTFGALGAGREIRE